MDLLFNNHISAARGDSANFEDLFADAVIFSAFSNIFD